MGRQIVQQPNGKWAVWTTICDDWLIEDATEAELWAFYEEDIEREVNELIARRKKEITEIIAALKEGGKPYYQFTETYEELGRMRLMNHPEYRETPWPECTCDDMNGCDKCEGSGEVLPWKVSKR